MTPFFSTDLLQNWVSAAPTAFLTPDPFCQGTRTSAAGLSEVAYSASTGNFQSPVAVLDFDAASFFTHPFCILARAHVNPTNTAPLFVVYDAAFGEMGSLTITANGTSLVLYGSSFTTNLDLTSTTNGPARELQFCYSNGIMTVYENCLALESHAFALPSIPAPSAGVQIGAYISPFNRFTDNDVFAVSSRLNGDPPLPLPLTWSLRCPRIFL